MNCHFSSILSFFLILTSFLLLVVGVEGYCVRCSHSHTHTVGLPRLGIGPSQTSLPVIAQHWQETDIHAPGGI